MTSHLGQVDIPHSISTKYPYWITVDRKCLVHHMMVSFVKAKQGCLFSQSYWGTIPDEQTWINPNEETILFQIKALLEDQEEKKETSVIRFLIFDQLEVSDLLWKQLWPLLTNPSAYQLLILLRVPSIPTELWMHGIWKLNDEPKYKLVHSSHRWIQYLCPDDLLLTQ